MGGDTKWRQYIKPVQTMDAIRAEKKIASEPRDAFTILDVRQPAEYELGHIPGAELIPLPDLFKRMGEIHTDKPVLVYCAMGSRSRVAAQMISEEGHKEVFDLAGGFNAWQSKRAFGDVFQGMALFPEDITPVQTLITAYSLEAGLEDFYLDMASRVKNEKTRSLFDQLSRIEVKHQDRLYQEYLARADNPVDREVFEGEIVASVMEGGLTTGEYIELFKPDLDSPPDVIGLAMSIEAQALDLYTRAASKTAQPGSKQALTQLADEEHTHLRRLGELLEEIMR